MKIRKHERGSITILEPAGCFDDKAAVDFERKVAALLREKKSRFIVDLAAVEQLSGGGLRALHTFHRRLTGSDGRLVLCRLNEQVRQVFEISQLIGDFCIAPSLGEAIRWLRSGQGDRLANAAPAPPAAGRSGARRSGKKVRIGRTKEIKDTVVMPKHDAETPAPEMPPATTASPPAREPLAEIAVEVRELISRGEFNKAAEELENAIAFRDVLVFGQREHAAGEPARTSAVRAATALPAGEIVAPIAPEHVGAALQKIDEAIRNALAAHEQRQTGQMPLQRPAEAVGRPQLSNGDFDQAMRRVAVRWVEQMLDNGDLDQAATALAKCEESWDAETFENLRQRLRRQREH